MALLLTTELWDVCELKIMTQPTYSEAHGKSAYTGKS